MSEDEFSSEKHAPYSIVELTEVNKSKEENELHIPNETVNPYNPTEEFNNNNNVSTPTVQLNDIETLNPLHSSTRRSTIASVSGKRKSVAILRAPKDLEASGEFVESSSDDAYVMTRGRGYTKGSALEENASALRMKAARPLSHKVKNFGSASPQWSLKKTASTSKTDISCGALIFRFIVPYLVSVIVVFIFLKTQPNDTIWTNFGLVNLWNPISKFGIANIWINFVISIGFITVGFGLIILLNYSVINFSWFESINNMFFNCKLFFLAWIFVNPHQGEDTVGDELPLIGKFYPQDWLSNLIIRAYFRKRSRLYWLMKLPKLSVTSTLIYNYPNYAIFPLVGFGGVVLVTVINFGHSFIGKTSCIRALRGWFQGYSRNDAAEKNVDQLRREEIYRANEFHVKLANFAIVFQWITDASLLSITLTQGIKTSGLTELGVIIANVQKYYVIIIALVDLLAFYSIYSETPEVRKDTDDDDENGIPQREIQFDGREKSKVTKFFQNLLLLICLGTGIAFFVIVHGLYLNDEWNSFTPSCPTGSIPMQPQSSVLGIQMWSQISLFECIVCDPGYYLDTHVNVRDGVGICIPCEEGSVSVAGASVCLPFSTNGCPVGSFQNVNNTAQCLTYGGVLSDGIYLGYSDKAFSAKIYYNNSMHYDTFSYFYCASVELGGSLLRMELFTYDFMNNEIMNVTARMAPIYLRNTTYSQYWVGPGASISFPDPNFGDGDYTSNFTINGTWQTDSYSDLILANSDDLNRSNDPINSTSFLYVPHDSLDGVPVAMYGGFASCNDPNDDFPWIDVAMPPDAKGFTLGLYTPPVSSTGKKKYKFA